MNNYVIASPSCLLHVQPIAAALILLRSCYVSKENDYETIQYVIFSNFVLNCLVSVRCKCSLLHLLVTRVWNEK
jgi:hypothetical protein